ncbi:MAG TPA: sigma-70 family RNA polymerase sigma factor, partial [Planctomycetota bacterium]|nr:sigma-70 family RNA polymerase sigma factor [Planctomycetota bacterium]
YLRALERPPRHAALKAWLARVGRNLALTALRREKSRLRRERAGARPEGQPSASDAAARLERHRLVVEAVLALEEPFRSAILLRFYEDLPPKEIARQLGVPVRKLAAGDGADPKTTIVAGDNELEIVLH